MFSGVFVGFSFSTMPTVADSGLFVSAKACVVVQYSEIVNAAKKVINDLIVFLVIMLVECLLQIVSECL